MSPRAPWTARPVFIISTFRDMHAERDWLHSHVFPEIAERLRERRQHLEVIDLRWGVDTSSAGCEAERESAVLGACLDEIERSRPFFIGLLGDRYGWRPPGVLLESAGFPGSMRGRSVTELEITAAALEAADGSQRSWFYLREALPYDTMPPEIAAQYSERHSDGRAAADSARKLADLKRRLRERLPDRTTDYTVKWDRVGRSVVGLESWGRRVLDNLWADLEEETLARPAGEQATWQDDDRRSLDGFVEDVGLGFVDREDVVDSVLAACVGSGGTDGNWGACIVAPSGLGKSALFARLCRRLDERDVLLLAHAAGAFRGSTRVDRMLLRWCCELSEHLGYTPPDDSLSSEDIEKAFGDLLARASEERRVVAALDALDEFEETTRGRHLTWLPHPWPRNARLVATSARGQQSEALLSRDSVEGVELAPLDAASSAKMIDLLCMRRHRQLDSRVVDELLAKKGPDGSRPTGNPLWVRLAVGILHSLGGLEYVQAEVRHADAPSGGERVARMLRDVARALPADVPGLYQVMFDRAASLFGRQTVDAFLQFLAVGRSGWRESDIRALVESATGEPLTALGFSRVRQYMLSDIVRKGAQAEWDFAHEEMRRMVLANAEARGVDLRRRHDGIVRHLLGLREGDPLRVSETMYHMLHGSDPTLECPLYLASLESDSEFEEASQTLAEFLLESAREESESRVRMVLSFLENEHLGPNIRSRVVTGLQFVDDYLEGRTTVSLRAEFLERLKSAMDLVGPPVLDPWSPVSPELLDRETRRFMIALKDGDLKVKGRRFDAARELYLEARAKVDRLEGLVGPHPEVLELRALVLERLGDVALAKGDFDAAGELQREALRLREKNLDEEDLLDE